MLDRGKEHQQFIIKVLRVKLSTSNTAKYLNTKVEGSKDEMNNILLRVKRFHKIITSS